MSDHTIWHIKADVLGMIQNRSFDGLLHEDGRPMSRQEAEFALRNLALQGVKFIPVSPDCEGFDPQKGCPGHPSPPPAPSERTRE